MRHNILLIVLCLSVLLFSTGATIKNASADAIMFPWIMTGKGISTVISVITKSAPGSGPDTFPKLHYAYYYKSVTDSLTAPCYMYDFFMPTSHQDIVSFDAAGNIGDGKALFNDPTNYGSFHFDLPVEPAIGFLIVNNNTPNFVQAGTNFDDTLYGEALILDHNSGTTWGYTAYNARYPETATHYYDPVMFSDGLDYQGEVIGNTETPLAVLLPPSQATTKFFVTPILHAQGYSAGTGPAQIANTAVRFCYDFAASNGQCLNGYVENDESVVSMSKKAEVVCTGILSLEDLMSAAALAHFKGSKGQGYAYIVTEPGTVQNMSPQPDAVIGKLEYNKSLIKITFPFKYKNPLGTFDNFLWIRSSDSFFIFQ